MTNPAEPRGTGSPAASPAHPNEPSGNLGVSARGGIRRRRLACAAAIVLAGLAVRVAFVGRHALWIDEICSLAYATGHSLEHAGDVSDPARGDFVQADVALAPEAYARYAEFSSTPAGPGDVIYSALKSDAHPPLYYLTLWAWMRMFGTGDAAMRLLSVTLWVACLVPFAAVAQRLGGPKAILPALLLFSASPLGVVYSTEGRMYAMLWFWTLMTTWQTLELNRAGPSAWRLGLWVAVSVGGLMSHLFFIFIWPVCIAWLLLHPGRLRREWTLAAAGLSVAVVSPWYIQLPQIMGMWRVSKDWDKIRPEGYRRPAALLKWLWTYFSPQCDRTKWHVVMMLTLAALAVMVVYRGGVNWFSTRRRLVWGIVLAALMGPLAIDLLRNSYTTEAARYSLAGMPAAYLLVASLWGRLGPKVRLVLGIAFVAAFVQGIRWFYEPEARSGDPFSQTARFLVDGSQAGDLVIVDGFPSSVVGMARYLDREGASARGIEMASWANRLGRRVPENLTPLLAGRKRVRLVIEGHDTLTSSPEKDWLKREAISLNEWQRGVITVLDFGPRGGDRFGGVAPAASPR